MSIRVWRVEAEQERPEPMSDPRKYEIVMARGRFFIADENGDPLENFLFFETYEEARDDLAERVANYDPTEED